MDVVQVTGGRGFSVALRSNGTVWIWGGDANGQSGNGTYSSSPSAPQEVQNSSGTGPLQGIVAVAAGEAHVLALSSLGVVYAWGWNDAGQVGLQPTYYSNSPLPVLVPGLVGVTAIAAGAQSSMALSNGTVRQWGRGSPTAAVVTGLPPIKAIGGGPEAFHALAVDDAGNVWAWGDNAYGELGTSPSACGSPSLTSVCTTPVHEVALPAAAASVAAGFDFSVAVTTAGDVYAWGLDNEGQVGGSAASSCAYGVNNVPCSFTPLRVNGPGGVSTVSAGYGHTLALTRGGAVWAWGADANGQLGNGQSPAGGVPPIEVKGAGGACLFNGVAIGTGSWHSLAVASSRDTCGVGSLAVGSATVTEPTAGTVPAPFLVTLYQPPARTVDVHYATRDGTAVAGKDYLPTSGTLTFVPGQTSQTVTVSVVGEQDTKPGQTLSFSVDLSAPVNAVIAAATGLGTILDPADGPQQGSPSGPNGAVGGTPQGPGSPTQGVGGSSQAPAQQAQATQAQQQAQQQAQAAQAQAQTQTQAQAQVQAQVQAQTQTQVQAQAQVQGQQQWQLQAGMMTERQREAEMQAEHIAGMVVNPSSYLATERRPSSPALAVVLGWVALLLVGGVAAAVRGRPGAGTPAHARDRVARLPSPARRQSRRMWWRVTARDIPA